VNRKHDDFVDNRIIRLT